MQSLAGENHYHRALCGNILISWNHIMRHMKIHPRKNQYQCDLCGKRLISRSKTNSHMKCHAREIQISGLCLARQLYPRTTISISLCFVWQNYSRNHTKRHMQKSFQIESIPLCSLWQCIHLLEPPQKTYEESCWEEPTQLWSVWQRVHLLEKT